ncbi:MAG: amidohydrolase family protein [Desulfobacterales bacterium]|nr:amidohydrolase family protein [Desulfobacterales bacterium]
MTEEKSTGPGILRALKIGLLLAWLLPAAAVAETALPGLKTPFSAIIDVHEHILSSRQADRFSLAIERHNLASIGLVGSPREVLFEIPEEKARFTNAAGNNAELLQISRSNPKQFHAFATYSPDDHEILTKLKQFIANGGHGLKLYNGHYRFYDIFTIPLDAPHLMPVYQYCEANRIPITYHVNSRYYWKELRHVLNTYPELVVNLPHFCMSLVNLDRIAEIFNAYPHVYTDISCGEGELAYTTLAYISRYWELYRELIVTYKTRFLFAADMVITANPKKDTRYVEAVIRNYRHLLESTHYTGILLDRYLENREIEKTPENSIFNGLQLDRETLQLIYAENPKRFLGIK